MGLRPVAAGGCVGVACRSPGSTLPLAVKSKATTLAVILMTADAQLSKRDMGASVTTPTPSLNRKPLRRTLFKNCDKILKCNSKLMASREGSGGEWLSSI